MIDAKQIAKRVAERYCGPATAKDVLSEIIAEEIRDAMDPPKLKSRGHEVAEEFIDSLADRGIRYPTFRFPIDKPFYGRMVLFSSDHEPAGCSFGERITEFRHSLAALIDLERTDAAKQEREACARVIEGMTASELTRGFRDIAADNIRFRVRADSGV